MTAIGPDDPHVVSLLYRLKYDDKVDFSNASALQIENDEFSVEMADGRATFTPKVHFATREEARAAVEPFIRSWEIDTELREGYWIKFVYERSEVINRAERPGDKTLYAEGLKCLNTFMDAKLTVARNAYPTPPQGFAANEDVAAMMEVYRSFKAGSFPLGSMGYRCLTDLEGSTGAKNNKRAAAAQRYRIAKTVLDTLGTLTSEKGGRTARKAAGSKVDYTAAERQWINATVKALIHRVGQVEAHPTGSFPEITMADLPKIP